MKENFYPKEDICLGYQTTTVQFFGVDEDGDLCFVDGNNVYSFYKGTTVLNTKDVKVKPLHTKEVWKEIRNALLNCNMTEEEIKEDNEFNKLFDEEAEQNRIYAKF